MRYQSLGSSQKKLSASVLPSISNSSWYPVSHISLFPIGISVFNALAKADITSGSSICHSPLAFRLEKVTLDALSRLRVWVRFTVFCSCIGASVQLMTVSSVSETWNFQVLFSVLCWKMRIHPLTFMAGLLPSRGPHPKDRSIHSDSVILSILMSDWFTSSSIKIALASNSSSNGIPGVGDGVGV